MASFTDDWKKVLEDFQDCVENELEEIRQHKAEVQALKSEMQQGVLQGLFYRDGDRLIISAPEVIIGNVDETGMLMPGFSRVTVRANQVDLQGVGESGAVESRASSIRNIAVDPGIDGKEEVVRSLSQVVSQASSIVLESHNATDVFSKSLGSTGSGGIRIHADGLLQLDASLTSDKHKSEVEARISELENSKSALKQVASDQKGTFESISKAIDDLMDSHEQLAADDSMLSSNYQDLSELQDQFSLYSQSLAKATENWIGTISSLAEVCRQLTALKNEKDAIVTGDDFKNNATGAAVSIVGERIDLVSADGEGNLRDNEGSGLGIVANEVTIESRDADKSLKAEGSVSLSAKTINMTTINPAEIEYDQDTGEVKKAKYPVDGDIFIRSKNISLEAVDNEVEDGESKETALTPQGKIFMRAETMDFNTTDTEGKATGSIAINSKALQMKSMDVDKEKRTDSKLAEGSSMLLLSEKMYVGSKDKDNKSKSLQAVSEEVGLFADKTLEAQQGEAKSVLQLADGNAAISGSKMQIYGDTTVNGKTEVKDELKAPKATIDNLEAKTSFKSSNISDGIAVPAPAAAVSLSAKLKQEDAPKEETSEE